jgi:hypothetical protein
MMSVVMVQVARQLWRGEHERGTIVDNTDSAKGSFWRFFSRVWATYVLRIFLLVVVYGLMNLFDVGTAFADEYEYPDYKVRNKDRAPLILTCTCAYHILQKNGKEYFSCLFEYSVESAQAGHERCGEPSSWGMAPHVWVLTYNIVLASMYGLVRTKWFTCVFMIS